MDDPIFHVDTKLAFFTWRFYKNRYLDQPVTYVKLQHKNNVLKIKRVLYRLKQAHKACVEVNVGANKQKRNEK